MLTAIFPGSLTIGGQTGNRIDQAVYVPAVGGRPAFIAGVRGGYVREFDPVTGAYLGSSRFCSPNFGACSICYDDGNDKLIASFWNNINDPARGLYKINPDTLAVELFASSASLAATFPQGFLHLAFYGGNLFAGGPNVGQIDPVTFVVIPILDPGPTGNELTVDTGAHDIYGVTGLLYVDAVNSQVKGYNYNAAEGYGGFSAYGICALPTTAVSGSNYFYVILYASTQDGIVYCSAGSSPTWSPTWSPIPLPVPGGGSSLAYHIRYNPSDQLVYVPDVINNCVYVINPNRTFGPSPNPPHHIFASVANNIDTTYTGFDSLIDVVFTPANVFAVQQGVVGLKLIK